MHIRQIALVAENASALIVARGGKIFASGTPDQPIVFTAEADDVLATRTSVTDASATLNASVNPFGLDTTCTFQFVTAEHWQRS